MREYTSFVRVISMMEILIYPNPQCQCNEVSKAACGLTLGAPDNNLFIHALWDCNQPVNVIGIIRLSTALAV